MGQKQGQVPAHIQSKTFSHPGVNRPCIIVLSKIMGSGFAKASIVCIAALIIFTSVHVAMHPELSLNLTVLSSAQLGYVIPCLAISIIGFLGYAYCDMKYQHQIKGLRKEA